MHTSTRNRQRETLSAIAIAWSTIALAPQAAAQAQIQATVMADNGAIVVHQQGNTYNVVQGSAGIWPTERSVNFMVPSDRASLPACNLHVIAWGDGGVSQGIMAHFSGTSGFTYTGQGSGNPQLPINQVNRSTVTWSGSMNNAQPFASNPANAANIIQNRQPAPSYWASNPLMVGAFPWQSYNVPATLQGRQNIAMVWDGTATTQNQARNNYRVISVPCSAIVAAKDTEETPPPPPPPVAPERAEGDHFQCYRVVDPRRMERQTITVSDQFGTERTQVVRPVMVCNPAVKRHGRLTFGVKDEHRHLVCYETLPERRPPARKVITHDQFAVQTLNLRERTMFCAPAGKNRLDAPEVALPNTAVSQGEGREVPARAVPVRRD